MNWNMHTANIMSCQAVSACSVISCTGRIPSWRLRSIRQGWGVRTCVTSTTSELCYLRLPQLSDLEKLWPVFQWSSQPVPSGIFLTKLPYHLPPLRKFRNFWSCRKYPTSQLSCNQWVVLVFRWRRMEDTCRKTRLEPSRDSLPRQADYESMHRASVLYSKSTCYRRGYTLRCVSRMWVSNVGWHSVKTM